jgi:hypothetical protein
MYRRGSITLALLLGATAACDHQPRDARAAETGTVDSARSREVTLAEFRSRIDTVEALDSVAGSREELFGAFVAALEERDTTALGHLAITPGEFGWLYYPTNPQGLPPYDLEPGLMWFMIEGKSREGLVRLLEQRAGAPLHYLGATCEGPSVQGENQVYGPCTVERLQAPGDTIRERLFGLVMERDGRWKFVSYANKLD